MRNVIFRTAIMPRISVILHYYLKLICVSLRFENKIAQNKDIIEWCYGTPKMLNKVSCV